jgi:hypothetical protein
VAVAIANDLKLPILYVGIGEGIDDLIPFRARTTWTRCSRRSGRRRPVDAAGAGPR